MKFEAKIEFRFDGALEVTAADNHTARLIFASHFGAVLDEIQTWPTIDLNKITVESELKSITPAEVPGDIRGLYDFRFVGFLEIDNGDEHTARVTLSELENAILDEVGNWPTTEIAEITLSAIITATL